jgi:hypothetical protein
MRSRLIAGSLSKNTIHWALIVCTVVVTCKGVAKRWIRFRLPPSYYIHKNTINLPSIYIQALYNRREIFIIADDHFCQEPRVLDGPCLITFLFLPLLLLLPILCEAVIVDSFRE